MIKEKDGEIHHGYPCPSLRHEPDGDAGSIYLTQQYLGIYGPGNTEASD